MARQRAQENEAWRYVRSSADAVLQQLQNGDAINFTKLFAQASFEESQAKWITLQFLVRQPFLVRLFARASTPGRILSVKNVRSYKSSIGINCKAPCCAVGVKNHIQKAVVEKYESTNCPQWLSQCMQESWKFVRCSEPLKANANMSSLIIQIGDPVNDLDKHPRLSDMKRACWLLWLDINGIPFTLQMFKQLSNIEYGNQCTLPIHFTCHPARVYAVD